MESRSGLEHGKGFITPPGETAAKSGYANVEGALEAHILDSPEAREAERKFIWKLDLIILPTISALYFFEYIDRGNIAVIPSGQSDLLSI